jgi:hypothetical protein
MVAQLDGCNGPYDRVSYPYTGTSAWQENISTAYLHIRTEYGDQPRFTIKGKNYNVNSPNQAGVGNFAHINSPSDLIVPFPTQQLSQ